MKSNNLDNFLKNPNLKRKDLNTNFNLIIDKLI